MADREMAMHRRKLNAQFTIDVRPFLGILAFIPLIFALVFTLLIVRICISCSDHLRLYLSWNFYYDTPSGKGLFTSPKKPTIFICGREGVTILPGKTMVAWDELQRPDSAVAGILATIETNSSKECVLLLARPESKRCFEMMRRILSMHNIEVMEDVVDAKFAMQNKFKNIGEYFLENRPPGL